MWSGLHPKADFNGSTGDVADVPIVLQKSFEHLGGKH